jgi:hypothetical protein
MPAVWGGLDVTRQTFVPTTVSGLNLSRPTGRRNGSEGGDLVGTEFLFREHEDLPLVKRAEDLLSRLIGQRSSEVDIADLCADEGFARTQVECGVGLSRLAIGEAPQLSRSGRGQQVSRCPWLSQD